MGKWAEPAFDEELSRKLKGLFEEVRAKIQEETQGGKEHTNYTFESFVENLDVQDQVTRRLFEYVVRQTRHLGGNPYTRPSLSRSTRPSVRPQWAHARAGSLQQAGGVHVEVDCEADRREALWTVEMHRQAAMRGGLAGFSPPTPDSLHHLPSTPDRELSEENEAATPTTISTDSRSDVTSAGSGEEHESDVSDYSASEFEDD